MHSFWELLLRGLLLRCPVCGQGKLYCGFFKMNERCPVCNFQFEREEGYFSSAMAINLVLSELIVTAFAIPLAANQAIPILPLLLWGAPFPFILPILFYWHSRSVWMSMDHYLNPIYRHKSSDNPTLPQ
ncbi:DUF983 domain-containing protein [Tengunoibacter tsumagoiensis]|uniref:DUF983 domain-containing protein n=1 Tax=Tengunoibacter tsumagoiensis TaxID=2014871 RepID=A0A402A3U1_9CHLR|nr:DUF983 domain-containing protein [Tengunoibacter tsumagoiensis]GCE13695.1 hypothetical protein KTT_35540 [Tengunoibacter tsumagoiensis]